MPTDRVQKDIVEKIDTEVSRFRDMGRIGQPWHFITRVLLIAMAPVGCFFVMDGPSRVGWAFLMQQYFAILLAMVLPLIFLMTPPFKGAAKDRLPWYDIGLAIVSCGLALYLAVFYADILMEIGIITPDRVILGTIAILVVVEAVRRMAGWVLALLGILFILYAAFNRLIPGLLGGKVIPWDYLVNYLFLDTNALLGTPMSVTATVVLPFILFGCLLQAVGGGAFLVDFATALFGGFRGGPAKMSVLTSSLFGTISGSAVANVVVDGVVTIPLMKGTGYKPHVAGAIEAVTSTGGQLMPPVMGAAAFVIAEFTGIPYPQIALAAIIPSILYYIGIFIQVDLEAGKMGLKGLPRDQLPRPRAVLKKCYLFVIPLLVLIWALFVLNMEVGKSALVASLSCLMMSLFSRETRTHPKWLVDALWQTGRGMLELTAVVSMAGFIIGVVTYTGASFVIPLVLGKLAGGNLFLLLVIIAIAGLILGMGMPTVAVYILLSLLLAPALIQLGVPVLAAHLYIMYWGMLSAITPPVALAAFAAAALAGASPMRTGYSAMRIGILVYIVPFLFVLGPALLLIGKPIEILVSSITAIVGSFMVGIGAVGYLFRDLTFPLRLLMGLAGLGLLIPVQVGRLPAIVILLANGGGGLLTILLLGWEWVVRRRSKINYKTEVSVSVTD
jgi:TRAP transporter 4TM/12TM fusion protein